MKEKENLGSSPVPGTKATAMEHNTVSTAESPYTSWTTSEDVAVNYALRPNGEGLVLQKTVPVSQTITSPNTKQVNLIQSPGTIVSENEVLLKGSISGAKPTIVTITPFY